MTPPLWPQLQLKFWHRRQLRRLSFWQCGGGSHGGLVFLPPPPLCRLRLPCSHFCAWIWTTHPAAKDPHFAPLMPPKRYLVPHAKRSRSRRGLSPSRRETASDSFGQMVRNNNAAIATLAKTTASRGAKTDAAIAALTANIAALAAGIGAQITALSARTEAASYFRSRVAFLPEVLQVTVVDTCIAKWQAEIASGKRIATAVPSADIDVLAHRLAREPATYDLVAKATEHVGTTLVSMTNASGWRMEPRISRLQCLKQSVDRLLAVIRTLPSRQHLCIRSNPGVGKSWALNALLWCGIRSLKPRSGPTKGWLVFGNECDNPDPIVVMSEAGIFTAKATTNTSVMRHRSSRRCCRPCSHSWTGLSLFTWTRKTRNSARRR